MTQKHFCTLECRFNDCPVFEEAEKEMRAEMIREGLPEGIVVFKLFETSVILLQNINALRYERMKDYTEMVTAEAWILNQREHVESLRSQPNLRDHMLLHGLDPDPDKIGITIGEIDLDTLQFMHEYDHEAMCACGRKLVVAQVQDFHQKAGPRLTMVCPISYVAPERCKASRTKVAAYHGY